jgi:hypothetical protein
MLCPYCYEENVEDAISCRQCGRSLEKHSMSLVPVRNRLPAALHHPQLPRLAAGVGAVAVGVGLELLRRGLLTRASRAPRVMGDTLPSISKMRDALMPSNEKTLKLPRNYEIEETVVYMRRVVRRKG